MNTSPLHFLVKGWRYEGDQFALRCILQSESPQRVAVVKDVTDEAFVYPVTLLGDKKATNKFSYLKDAPPDVLAAIRSGKGILAIDSSNEGTPANPKRLAQLHEILRELEIPAQRTIYLTQNRRFGGHVADWKKATGAEQAIHTGYYHSFMRDIIGYVAKEVIPSGEFDRRKNAVVTKIERKELRDKHYLCLNFTPRMHRIAIMLYLLKHNLLEKGLVSFSGLQNRKLDYRERAYNELTKVPFPDIESLKDLLPELHARGPFRLDVDHMGSSSPAIDIGEFWYYERSYLSLVTESGIRSSESRRFTEKVFKPMLGLHPFLIFGLAHTLEDLKDLGFKTFDNHLNPTYDGLEDPIERITALLAEFERLCSLPLEELDSLYRSLLPDLLHNYEYIAGDLRRVFVERIENPLLEQLRAIATAPLQ